MRREPAIRDFYDVLHGVKQLKLDLFETRFLALVMKKLSVPDNSPVDLSPQRKESLKAQMEVELRDVLRQSDYDVFNLDEAFAIVVAVSERLEKV